MPLLFLPFYQNEGGPRFRASIKLPVTHIKGLPATAGPFQLGENRLIRSRKGTLFTGGGADFLAFSCHFPLTWSSQEVGWHHRCDGHEFEQAPGVGDGQEGLVCCGSWDLKELDTTE